MFFAIVGLSPNTIEHIGKFSIANVGFNHQIVGFSRLYHCGTVNALFALVTHGCGNQSAFARQFAGRVFRGISTIVSTHLRTETHVHHPRFVLGFGKFLDISHIFRHFGSLQTGRNQYQFCIGSHSTEVVAYIRTGGNTRHVRGVRTLGFILGQCSGRLGLLFRIAAIPCTYHT